MANEVTLNAKLTISKGGASVTNLTSTKSQNIQSTLPGHQIDEVQSVGTSRTSISLGSIAVASQYFLLLRNQDPTNFVKVEVQSGVATWGVAGFMKPGETFGPVRCAAQSGGYPVYVLTADTAACDVEVVAGEAGDPTL
jgi:hypothetical protein